jgi:hypothetical protein
MSLSRSDPGTLSSPTPITSVHEIAQNTSLSALGYLNQYIINLSKKYLSVNEPVQIKPSHSWSDLPLVAPDRSHIKHMLSEDIKQYRGTIQDGSNGSGSKFVINSLLLEKMHERESLEKSNKTNVVLSVLVVVLPIVTNFCQFLITYLLPKDGPNCSS